MAKLSPEEKQRWDEATKKEGFFRSIIEWLLPSQIPEGLQDSHRKAKDETNALAIELAEKKKK